MESKAALQRLRFIKEMSPYRSSLNDKGILAPLILPHPVVQVSPAVALHLPRSHTGNTS